jgi:hypothetical protein
MTIRKPPGWCGGGVGSNHRKATPSQNLPCVDSVTDACLT